MPAGVYAFHHLFCDDLKVVNGQNWYNSVHLDKKYIYCLAGQVCLRFCVVDSLFIYKTDDNMIYEEGQPHQIYNKFDHPGSNYTYIFV